MDWHYWMRPWFWSVTSKQKSKKKEEWKRDIYLVCAKKKRANQMNKDPLEVDGRAAEDGGPYC